MTQTQINEYVQASATGKVKDSENPIFIFSMTSTELLVKIASGEIDAKQLAAYELSNRGKDLQGNWVGFKAAEEIFNSKF